MSGFLEALHAKKGLEVKEFRQWANSDNVELASGNRLL